MQKISNKTTVVPSEDAPRSGRPDLGRPHGTPESRDPYSTHTVALSKLAAFGFVFLLVGSLSAQFALPVEIKDNLPRQLQEKYLTQLEQFASDARAHHFPYAFYFSRTLDIEQADQPRVDQRSIRFDKYDGRIVLEMTGNYFASYAAKTMDANRRARQTFLDVMLPLLKAAVPRFAKIEGFQAYALEISHHVRRPVLGVQNETAENVVLLLPREAAQRLVDAKTPEQQQAAILDGEVFLDGEPFTLWLTGDPPPGTERPHKAKPQKTEHTEVASLEGAAAAPAIEPTVNPRLLGIKEPPPRVITAETLGALQVEHQNVVSRLIRELDPRAHFVAYAPPSFIAFRRAAYLQLSLTTPLDPSAAGSRYKLAALAFDDHISHLVRPVLAYFPENADFDGFDFSTTVKLPEAPSSVSIEFLFSLKAMRCFAQYECTGQQLIDSANILINGERAQLQLQTAEK